jgi:hypothetical protein
LKDGNVNPVAINFSHLGLKNSSGLQFHEQRIA